MKKMVWDGMVCVLIVTLFPIASAMIEKGINNHSTNKIMNGWHYLPAYPNYAPSGVPDFDQRQDNWRIPIALPINWSFCGPTAVADILWWFDSKYATSTGIPGDGNDDFPLVQDYNAPGMPNPGPNTDDHNFNNVNDLNSTWDPQNNQFGNEFIERVAWCVDTDGCRTGYGKWNTAPLDIVENINNRWLPGVGLKNAFRATLLYKPDFSTIVQLVEENNGIVLALVTKQLFHYVAVAGINSEEHKIALSDPYFDLLNPTDDPLEHNDASVVSHDIYEIDFSPPYPEYGKWWIPNYPPDEYGIVYCAIKICPDTTSPVVNISSPFQGMLYILGRPIISTPQGNTIIIGPINIQVNASDNCGIKKIDFLVDDVLKNVDVDEPFEWLWDEKIYGLHSIEVKAYDKLGNTASDKQEVWIFNI